MKAARSLASIVLFGVFLTAGFFTGRIANPFKSSRLPSASGRSDLAPAATPVPLPETGQRNLLIVGVNDLGASRPHLEGVWLVLHAAGEPKISFLPIYPALRNKEEDSTPQENLVKLFRLEAGRKPDPAFFAALQKKNIWWNGYLMFDRVALAGFAEWVSSGEERETLDGALAVSTVPPARKEPRQALLGQFRLAQELCRFTRQPASKDLSALLALFPGHADTDLDVGGAAGELANLLSKGGGISCEFPTLPVLLQGQ